MCAVKGNDWKGSTEVMERNNSKNSKERESLAGI